MKNLFLTHRFWTLWASALAVLGWYFITDPNGGAETLARLQWLAWIVVAAGPAYLLRRAFMDGARSCVAFDKALESPTGAGLVFLGLCLLTGLLFLATASQARADELPPGAVKYLPVLSAEIKGHWPAAPMPAALAGQVEQETCASLKSPKCWNPRTELKTDREYGFGLGQLTVTPRFDNFAEARKLDASLRDWQFADRYDPARQLRTLVLMDRNGFSRLAFIPDGRERMAMALASYNGGLGGVLSDRRVCAGTPGCDPARWFGNVERTSLKAKTAAKGYGKSFFEINREYVRNIMTVRAARYRSVMG